jgi:hypothetical protein
LIEKGKISFEHFSMEHKIDYLGEPRQSSIDGFISGDYQIAIEFKFTESEVGTCLRPRLAKKASNYQEEYCNGSYKRQENRKERCPLTEKKIKYWEYIPRLFKWKSNENIIPCPLHLNYQIVRNILAAVVNRTGGIASPTNGHAILFYDERNPSCQPNGKTLTAYKETKEALLDPQMLRKISWQRITDHMRKEMILPWFTYEIESKYGI